MTKGIIETHFHWQNMGWKKWD